MLKFIGFQELRRRRNEVSVELRRNKREDALSKRRNVMVEEIKSDEEGDVRKVQMNKLIVSNVTLLRAPPKVA